MGNTLRRTVWLVFLAIVLLGGCAAIAYFMLNARHDAQLARDADTGLSALYRGDFQAAQDYYARAMNEARTSEDKAAYELLLAASLERGNPQQAADHYLNVIGQTSLLEQTRGNASVYFLMFLNARSDPAFTKEVFARSPWAGLYQELRPDERINADYAITRAHEAILAAYPNFLSYLIAGDLYARRYPYLTGDTAQFRNTYALKAPGYFDKGVALLRAARDNGQWDKTRLAQGYAFAMSYAVELLDDKLGTMDDRTLFAFYLEAAAFADGTSKGEALMEQARLSIRLAFAGYLSEHHDAKGFATAPAIADELAALAAEPINQPTIASIMVASDSTTKYGRLKPALLFLASSSPALAKVLSGAVIHSQ